MKLQMGTTTQTIWREIIRQQFREHLEPWAQRHIDGALAGDPDAAKRLVLAASNAKRGMVTVGLYKAGTPNPAFRAALGSVWDHDHRELIEAAGTRRRLMAMFRRGDFPLPATEERVTIWRGTSALTKWQAERGLSWTTDRDTACWFAMRFAQANGRPLVLRREVARGEILYHSTNRRESEVIPTTIGPAIIDGDLNDWSFAHERHQNATRIETAAFINGGVGTQDFEACA